jgi:non-specific serine/threonine protein kinase
MRASDLSALPAGTKVREYEILSVLGGGQTSLVYKAYDGMLGRHVTLKEYLPAAFAARDERSQLAALPGKDEAFNEGLRRFVAEARVMTQFDHFALRRAYQFFLEGGSAYIVMPYYQGMTLRAKVHNDWRITQIGDLLMIVLPVLEGLSALHRANYCHCGVSPDNILIQDNDEPLLLDFGAIRQLGEYPDDCSPGDLTTGFAALEQYDTSRHGVGIGAWTDIYAVSAVVYYIVTGIVPAAPMARLAHDALRPLAGCATVELPGRLLEVFDQGLSVSPQERFMNLGAFVNALDAGVQGAIAQSSPATMAAAREILSVASATSLHSPRIRKILQSTWALRDRTCQQGAVGS